MNTTARKGAYDNALREMKKPQPNTGRAERWLGMAREAGDPRAAYALGTWYLHGEHVLRDQAKGVALIREAAAANVPDAVFDLAVSYERGVGVRQNLRKAAEFYLRAALLGEPQSPYEVGRCYYYGIGVAKDARMARVWLDYMDKSIPDGGGGIEPGAVPAAQRQRQRRGPRNGPRLRKEPLQRGTTES